MPVRALLRTILGTTTGAALDADGAGTIQQYLRGLLKAFLARVPAGGIAGLALETGGHLEETADHAHSIDDHVHSMDGKMPALGALAPSASTPVNTGPNRYVTFLSDITVAAGGGAGATQFACAANGLYEIELWPDWTGGANLSDDAVGVFKEGGAPAGDDDGEYIRVGQTRQILVVAGATIYVRTRANVANATRWKARRVDA